MEEPVCIRNKGMLLYSAEKAVNECASIESGNNTEEEIYFKIGTALHWISDCIERLPRKIKQGEIKFAGIMFANNCQKHKRTFIKASQDAGHSFPLSYPVRYGPNYVWASLDDVALMPGQEQDLKVYKEIFEGKNIVNSLMEVLEIVREYYDDL